MAHILPIQSHADDIEPIPVLNGSLPIVLASFNVELPNRDEVEEYAANHSDLAALLAGICARLRSAFGPSVELSLELYRDPEQQEQYLALFVRQEKFEAGILNQIESVSRPFMSQLEAASGHLLITTDFRRPRG
jgi:hypothetical protein